MGTLGVVIQETSQAEEFADRKTVLERAAIAMTEAGTTGERSATAKRAWRRQRVEKKRPTAKQRGRKAARTIG
jgi:hypothetical protein